MKRKPLDHREKRLFRLLAKRSAIKKKTFYQVADGLGEEEILLSKQLSGLQAQSGRLHNNVKSCLSEFASRSVISSKRGLKLSRILRFSQVCMIVREQMYAEGERLQQQSKKLAGKRNEAIDYATKEEKREDLLKKLLHHDKKLRNAWTRLSDANELDDLLTMRPLRMVTRPVQLASRPAKKGAAL